MEVEAARRGYSESVRNSQPAKSAPVKKDEEDRNSQPAKSAPARKDEYVRNS